MDKKILIFIMVIILIIIIVLLVFKIKTKTKTKTFSKVGGFDPTYIIDLINQPSRIDSFDTKKNLYKSPSSDEQIKSVLKYGSPTEIGRLKQLIKKFYKPFGLSNDMNLNRSDSEIFQTIPTFTVSDNDHLERDKWHAKLIYDTLKPFLTKTNKIMVDIGCNKGGITSEVARLSNIEKAIGIDVIDPKLVSKDIKYIKLQSNSKIKLPLKDKSVDLVMANMTFHHIKNLDEYVKEIVRILKPNGILYIREHDCWTAIDAMLIDIEHRLYNHVGGDSGDYEYYHYTNSWGWDKILEPLVRKSFGFFYMNERPDISPTRGFWAIYFKA